MSSPTSMSNTNGTTNILITTIFTKIVNLTFRLVNVQVAIIIDESYTGAIVSAIFQSAQAFDKYWESFFIPDVSYDSTHKLFCRFVV